MSKIKIAVFASGTGSNTQTIINYFKSHALIEIDVIVSNKPSSGVIQIAEKAGIEVHIIDKNIYRNNDLIHFLTTRKTCFIILAGFLWKIPTPLINAFPQHIINIHPALLPKYGGQGMYGHFVHDAVIAAGEIKSGITIHYVDEEYDHGGTIFQITCDIAPNETANTLTKKIRALEHAHFAPTIEKVILGDLP